MFINLFLLLYLQKLKHPSAFTKYKIEVVDPKNKSAAARKRRSEPDNDESTTNPNKRSKTVPSWLKSSGDAKSKKQLQLEEDLVDFVISGMRPFSIVDDKSFKKLFSFAPEMHVMSRRTLMERIKAKTQLDHEETLAELRKTDCVCTMTDVWSTKHHSFLGVSAHWLDDNMERRSRVLACPHFRNPHSGERIASTLQAVHDENELGGKLITTSTDNASNMVNAFDYYGVKLNDSEEDLEESESSEEEQEAVEAPGGVTVHDYDLELNAMLPIHQRQV